MKVYVAGGQDFHEQHAPEEFPIRDTHSSRVRFPYSLRVSAPTRTTTPICGTRCRRVSVRSPQHIRAAVAQGRHHTQTDSPARGSSTRCAQTKASTAITDREVQTTLATHPAAIRNQWPIQTKRAITARRRTRHAVVLRFHNRHRDVMSSIRTTFEPKGALQSTNELAVTPRGCLAPDIFRRPMSARETDVSSLDSQTQKNTERESSQGKTLPRSVTRVSLVRVKKAF